MHFLFRLRYAGLLTLLVLMFSGTLAAQTQEELDNLALDSLFHKVNSPKLTTPVQVECFFHIGLIYNKKEIVDSARLYYEKALELPGGKEFEGGRIIVNLGNLYASQGENTIALKYYLEGLKTAEKEKSNQFRSDNTVRAAANISEAYYIIGNYTQALYYAKLALKNYDNGGAVYILPQIYYVIGSVYLEQGMLDQAEENILKSYSISESIYNMNGNGGGIVIYKSYGMEGLAKIYLARQDYEKALECANEAIIFAKEDGNPAGLAKAWSTLSDIYLKQECYEDSKKSAMKAMELSSLAIEQHPNLAFNIATADLFSGNKEEAYHYFQIHSDQIKEKTDKNFRETMAIMEIQFETNKKETRITSLERQRILSVSVGIAAALLAIAIWIVFRQRIRQVKQEKQLIAAHAVLEGEEAERKRLARDLHDSLGGMLSSVKFGLTNLLQLQDINQKLDNCIEEVGRIAHHLMPVSLERYGMKAALEDYCRSFPNARFHFFGEDKRINEQIEYTIYFCTYELVNNSFKHSGATLIDIQLIQNDKYISLTVQDNGSGFDKESAPQGAGLKNISDRVAAFTGKMDVTSFPGKGTETIIELKV